MGESRQVRKDLAQVATAQPFPGYAEWWVVGQRFASFMSDAIVSEWTGLPADGDNLSGVGHYLSEYLRVVYGRKTSPSLLDDFVEKRLERQIYSGEFDALSYAFYRSAFERIASATGVSGEEMARQRRQFAARVGSRFFRSVHDHVSLDLPPGLNDERDLGRLKTAIDRVGSFLQAQGYLRDHFAFRFAVDVEHAGQRIAQTEAAFMENLKRGVTGYALYEMGFPIILPSAVYLYQTMGEAQHHSSRTIEELFAVVGYEARETDDFDPTGFPPELVVELWEISR